MITKSKKDFRLLGCDKDALLKGFFGGNALTAIVILGLITVFLFKEGIEFFGQNREGLDRYRRSGMEYAAIVTDQHDAQTLLYRYLETILSKETEEADRRIDEGELAADERASTLGPLQEYARSFQDAKESLLDYEKEVVKLARETKLFLTTRDVVSELRKVADGAGLPDDGSFSITGEEITERRSFAYVELERWRNYFIRHQREELSRKIDTAPASDFSEDKKAVFDHAGAIRKTFNEHYLVVVSEQETAFRKLIDGYSGSFLLMESGDEFRTFHKAVEEYLSKTEAYKKRLEDWDPEIPFPLSRALTSFVFGKDWVTNSARQDWYGILPLFTGSLLVTLIALSLAIPFGVGAAIYANQVANFREQSVIKPFIEFVSAIPSVVIGFFGIAVLGEFVGDFSDERLNSLTAGALLALMAVPTIFTLAEDALNNVPAAFREASLSLGATRLQTAARVIVPGALTGIVSAVLLGMGRVIGETMVVLLCAGNRIAIPDFTSGLGVFTQPVHTMTGIIAQEMGEVEFESIHYRALFMVGIVLFLTSLLINFLSQRIAGKYKDGY